MLRILGRPSSINVRKVLWTAEEVGAAFTHEPQWGTPPENLKSPEFLRLNPNGLIPVIEDENGVLWESNAICRYLAAKHQRRDLFPDAPGDRARVDQWMEWQATELNESWRYAFLALLRKDAAYSDQRLIEASALRWNAMMGILDRRLQTTEAFVAGPDFSLADIVLALSVHRWRATPIEHADLACVRVWLARIEERPIFRKLTAWP